MSKKFKLEYEVDDSKTEATAFPIWYIVMLHRQKLCSKDSLPYEIMLRLVGPFVSRESAEKQRQRRLHHYGESSVVYCASAIDSDLKEIKGQ